MGEASALVRVIHGGGEDDGFVDNTHFPRLRHRHRRHLSPLAMTMQAVTTAALHAVGEQRDNNNHNDINVDISLRIPRRQHHPHHRHYSPMYHFGAGRDYC